MTNWEEELNAYRSRVLPDLDWLFKTYGGNGSIIIKSYQSMFDYILKDKVDVMIITLDEFLLNKDGATIFSQKVGAEECLEIYPHLTDKQLEAFIKADRHSMAVSRHMFVAISERDPVLGKYMKVIENTEERVEIHFVYPHVAP